MAVYKPLPSGVTIDGEEYPINTDFRVWIEFEELIRSPRSDTDKLVEAIRLVFTSRLPPRVDLAIGAMMEFYTRPMRQQRKRGTGGGKPCISFIDDEELITAAFLQCYNIDLTTSALHWWRFRSLIAAMPEETQLVKVMSWRALDISEIKDSKLRSHYKMLKGMYELPDRRTDEEREADMQGALDAMIL